MNRSPTTRPRTRRPVLATLAGAHLAFVVGPGVAATAAAGFGNDSGDSFVQSLTTEEQAPSNRSMASSTVQDRVLAS